MANRPNQESFGFLLTPPSGGETGDGQARAAVTMASERMMGDRLTHVTLFWQHGQREHWLRFGKPVATCLLDHRCRRESYAPGQIFALVRWAGADHGTVLSHLAIVRVVARGKAVTPLASVDPGGDILLAVQGWRRVARVFALIDAIEALGLAPEDVAPDLWRQIHHCLAAREARRGTDARHRALRQTRQRIRS